MACNSNSIRPDKLLYWFGFDLVVLYELETIVLNPYVTKLYQFSDDLMIRLILDEWPLMQSQLLTT